jgi:hypothetical protein
MQHPFGVTQWKELFTETGLDEAMMDKWHRLFEAKYPESHQGFLHWLGLSQEQIADIRNHYK